jgi:choice-of-anchor C domain-containing protein
MKRVQYLMLGLLAVALLAVSPVHAALFQNGDFGGLPVPGSFITLYGGDTSIPGWKVTGDSIDYIGGYWQAPPAVSTSIDLDGNGQGGIQQTFDTTPGATYKVSFYLAGNPDGGPNPKQLLVTTVGSTPYNFDASGTNRGAMGWTPETFAFTATSASTTLSFDSQTAGYYGPAIGEVSVSQTPLPPTVFLLGSGLAGLGMLRFRRKT